MRGSYFIDLEKHPTKDVSDGHINGSLTVIWRDYDNIFEKEPRMLYISSVNVGEIKGPHLHTVRNSYFTCIHGKVLFIIKDKTGKYHEIESSEECPRMIIVPKGIPSAHVNLSNGISRVLAVADVAWKPNDGEMQNVTFDDYSLEKWRINK